MTWASISNWVSTSVSDSTTRSLAALRSLCGRARRQDLVGGQRVGHVAGQRQLLDPLRQRLGGRGARAAPWPGARRRPGPSRRPIGVAGGARGSAPAGSSGAHRLALARPQPGALAASRSAFSSGVSKASSPARTPSSSGLRCAGRANAGSGTASRPGRRRGLARLDAVGRQVGRRLLVGRRPVGGSSRSRASISRSGMACTGVAVTTSTPNAPTSRSSRIAPYPVTAASSGLEARKPIMPPASRIRCGAVGRCRAGAGERCTSPVAETVSAARPMPRRPSACAVLRVAQQPDAETRAGRAAGPARPGPRVPSTTACTTSPDRSGQPPPLAGGDDDRQADQGEAEAVAAQRRVEVAGGVADPAGACRRPGAPRPSRRRGPRGPAAATPPRRACRVEARGLRLAWSLAAAGRRAGATRGGWAGPAEDRACVARAGEDVRVAMIPTLPVSHTHTTSLGSHTGCVSAGPDSLSWIAADSPPVGPGRPAWRQMVTTDCLDRPGRRAPAAM